MKTPNKLIVGDFLTAIVSMILFLAILFAASFLVKRYVKNGTFTNPGGKISGNMKIIEKLSISSSQLILLVKVCNEYLVLGVTNGNIQTLAQLMPEETEITEQPQTDSPPSAFFDFFKKKTTHHPSDNSENPTEKENSDIFDNKENSDSKNNSDKKENSENNE
jgi:flagellar biosynthetic protein FliO